MGDKNKTKIKYQERNQTKMKCKFENFKRKDVARETNINTSRVLFGLINKVFKPEKTSNQIKIILNSGIKCFLSSQRMQKLYDN